MNLTFRRPPGWLVAVLVCQVGVQVAVSISRPVTSYRLVAAGFDATVVGLVAAAFAVPPMLLALPLGRFSDRASTPIVVAGCLITSIAALGLSLSTSVAVLAVSTGLLGIGHLGTVVGTQSLVAQSSLGRSRMSMFGMLTAAASIGQMIGPALGGIIAQPGSGSPTLTSTGVSLRVAAGFALVALPAALVLHARSPRSPQAGPAGPARRLSIRQLLTTAGMPAALMSSFGSKGASDMLLTYLPLLGVSIGLSAGRVGVFLSLSAAAAIVARFAMPALLARVSPRPVVIWSTAFSGLTIACMPLVSSGWSLGPIMVALGFMLALSQTISMVWVASVAPDGSEGAALGLRLATNRVGQVATPSLAALVAGVSGLLGVFWMLSALMGVASASTWLSRPRGMEQDGPLGY